VDEGIILTVCTGNVCRSPLLERLIQGALDERYGAGAVPVRSAGTRALVGSPMDERAAGVLGALGGSHTGFVGRRLTEQMVREASLVLTATRDHRADVARLHPRALKRTFTFRELADILGRLPVEDLPQDEDPRARIVELARVAAAGRGVRAPRTWTDFDIVDPYRRDDAVYATMRDQVVSALPAVLTGLVGPGRQNLAP
jgi:protein-tyrosine phosphatase